MHYVHMCLVCYNDLLILCLLEYLCDPTLCIDIALDLS